MKLIGAFVMKLTQLEKTGSISKVSISLGNLMFNFRFRNKKSITFFATFTFLLFASVVCIHFIKGVEVKLKKSEVKPSVNKFS